jgi:hypothetical protein
VLAVLPYLVALVVGVPAGDAVAMLEQVAQALGTTAVLRGCRRWSRA